MRIPRIHGQKYQYHVIPIIVLQYLYTCNHLYNVAWNWTISNIITHIRIHIHICMMWWFDISSNISAIECENLHMIWNVQDSPKKMCSEEIAMGGFLTIGLWLQTIDYQYPWLQYLLNIIWICGDVGAPKFWVNSHCELCFQLGSPNGQTGLHGHSPNGQFRGVDPMLVFVVGRQRK